MVSAEKPIQSFLSTDLHVSTSLKRYPNNKMLKPKRRGLAGHIGFMTSDIQFSFSRVKNFSAFFVFCFLIQVKKLRRQLHDHD